MLAGRLLMSGSIIGSQLYTTPGIFTFVVPTGVTSLRATVIGGGGAGGVGIDDGSNTGGGGGGGSAGAIQGTFAVTAGNNVDLRVGAAGGQSYVQYLYGVVPQIFGNAGGGGESYNFSLGLAGAGGTAGTTSSSNATNVTSSNGAVGSAGGANVAGGNGANRAAFFGYSGTGGTGDTTGVATIAAMSASGYGAGGGGSRDRATVPTQVSGAGASGVVLLEWGF